MPRNSKFLALFLVLWASYANAQGITPVGGGGGSGSGTVTNVATSCGISGGPITTTGTISAIATQSTQAGSNYAFVTGDCGTIVYLNNASPQIPIIPQAGTTGFATGWFVEVCNIGAGTQTITPATSTIGGASTYVLAAGTSAAPKCIGVNSNGINYVLDLTGPGGSSSSGANPSATASDTVVNGSATTFMRSDGAPAVQKGSNAQFGLVEGDGTSLSLVAGIAQRTALTGDVTASAGSSVTTLAAGSASNLNSGTLAAARMPALTGDCVTGAGAVATTCQGIHPTYVASNWYVPGGVGPGAAGGIVSANVIRCFPAYVPQKITVGALAARLTTLAVTGNVQLAIYTDSSNAPGVLLSSTASISTTSAGTISAALAGNKQVGPGGTDGGANLWFCENVDTTAGGVAIFQVQPLANTTTQYLAGTATLANVIGSATSGSGGKSCSGAACTGGSSTFNTWPSTLVGSTFSDITTPIMPVIAFQVASVP